LHVPVLIFGPGDAALAHQPEEAVSIAAMLDAARVYASAALAWLA
jgi:acetylornithine deacetylase/succinyl-diaminopimelate desuccinylase-like protein